MALFAIHSETGFIHFEKKTGRVAGLQCRGFAASGRRNRSHVNEMLARMCGLFKSGGVGERSLTKVTNGEGLSIECCQAARIEIVCCWKCSNPAQGRIGRRIQANLRSVVDCGRTGVHVHGGPAATSPRSNCVASFCV